MNSLPPRRTWRLTAGPLALALSACLVLGLLDLALRPQPPAPARAVWPPGVPPPAVSLVRQDAGQIPMPAGVPAAHASTLVAGLAQQPVSVWAFWFAGSRESGPDVRIVASGFDRSIGQWLPARWVVSREALAAPLGYGVRRLGNPVAWRDGQGRIHLFVVATGLGGWAASRIVQLRTPGPVAAPQDLHFELVRSLPLSWLWNISHLVRAMPLPLADGGMVLPAYFELGLKYPVALRFDAQGELLGQARMSSRGHLLQPTLVAQSETRWLGLARDNSAQRQLRAVVTPDGGQHWADLPDPPLANPDASVVALALRPDELLLAHNSRRDGRTVLDLSLSTDGQSWQTLATVARGGGRDEFSYPAMAWADGSLWVSYTDQRRAIAWQRYAPVRRAEPAP